MFPCDTAYGTSEIVPKHEYLPSDDAVLSLGRADSRTWGARSAPSIPAISARHAAASSPVVEPRRRIGGVLLYDTPSASRPLSLQYTGRSRSLRCAPLS